MPIYEYECQKCKAHIEIMQKVSDKPLTKCRKCGGKLEKQWSPTSFQFKGSGWYVTDYASKKSDAKEEKKSAAPAEAPAATGDQAASKEAPAAKKTSTNSTAPASTNASGD